MNRISMYRFGFGAWFGIDMVRLETDSRLKKSQLVSKSRCNVCAFYNSDEIGENLEGRFRISAETATFSIMPFWRLNVKLSGKWLF